MPCPERFEWFDDVKKCYTTDMQDWGNWSVAVESCKTMYPGAKLAEPRSEKENLRLQKIAGMEIDNMTETRKLN